jgi:hypothetical protein
MLKILQQKKLKENKFVKENIILKKYNIEIFLFQHDGIFKVN